MSALWAFTRPSSLLSSLLSPCAAYTIIYYIILYDSIVYDIISYHIILYYGSAGIKR